MSFATDQLKTGPYGRTSAEGIYFVKLAEIMLPMSNFMYGLGWSRFYEYDLLHDMINGGVTDINRFSSIEPFIIPVCLWILAELDSTPSVKIFGIC